MRHAHDDDVAACEGNGWGRAPTGPACSVDNGPCACTPTGTKDTRAGRSDPDEPPHPAADRRLSRLTYPPVVPAREPARWWTLVLAVAGGLLTRLAFPEPGWWGTAFLGVALLYLALRRDSARWNALVGLVWGLTFFLPLITWADEAVGLVPWLALSTLEAAYFALFGAAWTLGAPGQRGLAQRRPAGGRLHDPVRRDRGARRGLAVRRASRGGGWRSPRPTRRSPRSPRWGGTPLLTGAVVAVGVLLARILLAARRLRARSAGRRDAPSSAACSWSA